MSVNIKKDYISQLPSYGENILKSWEWNSEFCSCFQIKCDQYWPGRGAETYGLMHVLLVDITELATYTVRTFHIQKVCQFTVIVN